MNEPVVETVIGEHYQKFLSHEAEEMKERLGVDYPQEMTYLDFVEMLQEWHTMGISVTFDIDLPDS
jgi:hypothetical protein